MFIPLAQRIIMLKNLLLMVSFSRSPAYTLPDSVNPIGKENRQPGVSGTACFYNN